jgi:hypothetical protein
MQKFIDLVTIKRRVINSQFGHSFTFSSLGCSHQLRICDVYILYLGVYILFLGVYILLSRVYILIEDVYILLLTVYIFISDV